MKICGLVKGTNFYQFAEGFGLAEGIEFIIENSFEKNPLVWAFAYGPDDASDDALMKEAEAFARVPQYKIGKD